MIISKQKKTWQIMLPIREGKFKNNPAFYIVPSDSELAAKMKQLAPFVLFTEGKPGELKDILPDEETRAEKIAESDNEIKSRPEETDKLSTGEISELRELLTGIKEARETSGDTAEIAVDIREVGRQMYEAAAVTTALSRDITVDTTEPGKGVRGS